jgi:hypothetical protein
VIVRQGEIRSAGAEHAGRGDAVGSWLDGFEALLRLPRAGEIREELEGHLRDRVRDLMVGGIDESEAMTRAIGELGDAAQLVARFHDSQRIPRRRLIMNASILLAAGGALAISVGAWSAATEKIPDGAGEGIPYMADVPLLGRRYAGEGIGAELSLKVEVRGAALEDVLASIAVGTDNALFVHWSRLESIGLERDAEIAIDLPEVPVPALMRLLSSRLDLWGTDMLDYRVEDGLFEVATREFFDLREAELVSYDLDGVLRPEVSGDEVVDLIVSVIEPESWNSNGGVIGSTHALGDKLFVTAPPRLQRRVEWVIDEMRRDSAPALETRVFRLRHAPAGEVSRALARRAGDLGGLDAFTVDERSNSVLVKGDAASLAAIAGGWRRSTCLPSRPAPQEDSVGAGAPRAPRVSGRLRAARRPDSLSACPAAERAADRVEARRAKSAASGPGVCSVPVRMSALTPALRVVKMRPTLAGDPHDLPLLQREQRQGDRLSRQRWRKGDPPSPAVCRVPQAVHDLRARRGVAPPDRGQA